MTERRGPNPIALSVKNHDRDAAGLLYVYPVVSRRAGGVSVGINLNPNNACNWRCVYCQVPELQRGAGPTIDLERLEAELRQLLGEILDGDFLEKSAPPEARVLRDLAFSGNGEPLSCPQFNETIAVVSRVRRQRLANHPSHWVLITNGSLVRRAQVQAGLAQLSSDGGELWFKLDAGTDAALAEHNGAAGSLAAHLERLVFASRVCRTKVQSCWFVRRGSEPSSEQVEGWLAGLRWVREQGATLAGVQLYTLARPSMQPEAAELAAVSADWLDGLARRVRELGLPVEVAT